MIVRIVLAVIAVALIGTAVVFLSRTEPREPMQPPRDPVAAIHEKVAVDAEIQYGIASRNGSAMDRCVQAGMAAAAQLQAKNEGAYSTWKKIESVDCQEAGVPR